MAVEHAAMMAVDFVARCLAMYAKGHGGSGKKPSDYQSGGKYYGMAGNMMWLVRGTNISVNGNTRFFLKGTVSVITGNMQSLENREVR